MCDWGKTSDPGTLNNFFYVYILRARLVCHWGYWRGAIHPFQSWYRPKFSNPNHCSYFRSRQDAYFSPNIILIGDLCVWMEQNLDAKIWVQGTQFTHPNLFRSCTYRCSIKTNLRNSYKRFNVIQNMNGSKFEIKADIRTEMSELHPSSWTLNGIEAKSYWEIPWVNIMHAK